MNQHKKEKPIDVYIISTNSSSKETSSRTRAFWHVDMEMLRFKVHYFLYAAGAAAGLPYVVVFAKEQIGISASSLGAVLTTQMFLFIFTKTMIGYLADYFNKLKIMISVLTTISTLCFFLFLALPSIEIDNFHNSTEVVIENALKIHDISNQCIKYQDIFSRTVNQKIGNVTILEVSSFNFSKSTLLNEMATETCNSFSENDFASLLQNSIKQYLDSSKYYLYQIDSKNSSAKTISCSFKIVIFPSTTDSVNAKMCQFSSFSPVKNPAENLPLKIIEEPCKFPSKLKIKSDLNPFLDVEFHCAMCGFQNMTLDPLVTIPGKTQRKKDIETYQFWIFSLLYTISGVCINAIFTLSDTACCESIQKHGGDFGQQRLWGAIGWGSVAPLAGFINDYTEGFLASYILMGAMMVLFLWNISKIDLVKPHYSKNILKDVGAVLSSKDFLMFETVVIMNGLGTGMIWFYLIWFLVSIGGSELLCGLALTVQSFIGMIPFMFFSRWIIRKFGHFNILIIALLGYTIRFMWYSYLQNPWLVLPTEFLHGITHGLYYTALASYAKMSAKPGTEATTQAIIFSTHEGLGSGIGCVLSGIGFDYFGGHLTFFYGSMFCLCGAFLGLILSIHLRSRKGILKLPSACNT